MISPPIIIKKKSVADLKINLKEGSSGTSSSSSSELSESSSSEEISDEDSYGDGGGS